MAFPPAKNFENLGPGYFDVQADSESYARVLASMSNNNSVLEIWEKKLEVLPREVSLSGVGAYTIDQIEPNGTMYRVYITVYLLKPTSPKK